MATVAQDNIKKSIAPKSVCDNAKDFVDSSISFNQGDLMFLDTSAHLIKPIAADADSVTCIGVARNTVVSGALKSPYSGTAVDAAQAVDHIAGPVYGVEVELTLKTSDSVNPGDLIYPYPTTDAQTVTVTSSGASHKAIGHYVGPAKASVAAGTKIVVMLGARFPQDALKY